jgi:CBS domain-containing protein
MKWKEISQLRVSDVMTSPVMTLGPHLTAREAARMLDKHRISGAPVVDKRRRVLGVVSQSDLIHQESESGSVRELGEFITDVEDYRDLDRLPAERWSTHIERLMTRKVVSVELDTPIAMAATIMRERGIHRLLVTDQGALVGVVTTQDVLRVVEAIGSAEE